MVQNAARDPSWPDISPRVAELFRQGARAALDPPPEWLEGLHQASLSSPRMRPIADDPALETAVRRSNLANLRQWAATNLREPGTRVPVNLDAEMLESARDLVRRGLDRGVLDSFRVAQSFVWRRWLQICFGLTTDTADLQVLLDVSALSIATFIEDTITAVSERMDTERAELTRGAHAERRATVTLLLEGAPISRARAENQLGYRLTGPHTAAIVWNTATPAPEQLEAAAEALVRISGATGRLTIVASAAALWLWLPISSEPSADGLTRELAAYPEVRVAVGRPGADVDGFRRSHLDAAGTQRMLTRLTSPRHVARYADIQLVALLTGEPAQTDEFLADTLGELLRADTETRETVATYLREQCSTSRTAERLFTHRNTVQRRLDRADRLLPRPLADNPLNVAAALEVLRWRG
ncbi:PucR family transcriptional regulator [Actinoplanes sp. NPDC023801]|uniref:PucR family transcriptional regulator n=1 Tax=Actinoplanes sp. NPDC023801 TaxID=3154595 RepID=UPI0033E854EC